MKRIKAKLLEISDKIHKDDMEYSIYGKDEFRRELKILNSIEDAIHYLKAMKEECDFLAEEEEDNSYLNIKREIENYEKTLKVWLKTLQI